jgi:hypothetical protein
VSVAYPARLGTTIRGKSMHRLVTIIATLGVCALTSCASQPAPSPVTASPGAGGHVFLWGTLVGTKFKWNTADLTFDGRRYPFDLNGLSVDVGVTQVRITGFVSNMHTEPDFNGNYVSIASDPSGSVTSLRNQNGVVIDEITTQEGVRLTVAPAGVNIMLRPPR